MCKNLTHCSTHGCTAATFTPVEDDWVEVPAAERGGRGRWQCPYHAQVVYGYSDENSTRSGKNLDGFTYSVEFEVDDPSAVLRSTLMHYKWMPTHDCTVDCEFKSPIYNNLKWHKLLDTVEDILTNDGGCVSRRCGTHFHVGNRYHINEDTMGRIRFGYAELFLPLSDHLAANPAKCRALFGRELNDWAEPIHEYTWCREHTNFINVQHDATLEFRMCKFRTAAQYKLAMEFCKDTVKAIINQYLSNWYNKGTFGDVAEAYRLHKAECVGRHLVKLFERYAAKAMNL